MSIAGNQYFSGVKNTVVNKETLANPLSGTEVFNNFLTHGTAAVLTTPELLQARDKTLFLDIETGLGPCDLLLGPDTATGALNLANSLGLTQNGQKCILSITGVGMTGPKIDADLANSSGTSTNVKVALGGVTSGSGTAILASSTGGAGSLPGAVGYVEVTAVNVTDASAGYQVLFNVLNQIVRQ